MKQYWDKIPSMFKNFYILTGILFILWMLLFDTHDIITQVSEKYKYNKLVKQKEFYEEKIKQVEEDIESLRTDDESLERFARENYRMKKPTEEVYIIIEEK